MSAIKQMPISQLNKLKQAVRNRECDPDEKRWKEKLRKVVMQKPEEKKA